MAASPFAVFPAASSTRQIWRFGLLCSAFAALWFIGLAYGLGTDSALDTLLCHQLAAASAWGLRVMGWAASTDVKLPNFLLINNQQAVIVGPPCDGLVLYALLAGFVLAYPGPAQRRLWFIPMGIAALWLLNIVRIIVLALNHQYSPKTFDFNHHYAFSAVTYAALGGLWLLWTRQASAARASAKAWLGTDNQPVTSIRKPVRVTVRVVAGIALLLTLALVGLYQSEITAALSAGWATALANGPAWLQRVPGAMAGSGTVPSNVTHLALPVGVAYLGLFLAIALMALRLLLPDRGWRTAWRCYASMGLAYVLLLLVGRVMASPLIYRVDRMILDLMVSLLPIAGLLVLLWRPIPKVPLVPAE